MYSLQLLSKTERFQLKYLNIDHNLEKQVLTRNVTNNGKGFDYSTFTSLLLFVIVVLLTSGNVLIDCFEHLSTVHGLNFEAALKVAYVVIKELSNCSPQPGKHRANLTSTSEASY